MEQPDKPSRAEVWGWVKGLVFVSMLIAFVLLPFVRFDVDTGDPESRPSECASVWKAGGEGRSAADPIRRETICQNKRIRTVAWMVMLGVPLCAMFSVWMSHSDTRQDQRGRRLGPEYWDGR